MGEQRRIRDFSLSGTKEIVYFVGLLNTMKD